MGAMQLAVSLIIVLGISGSAKGVYNGSWGGLGSSYYNHLPPYYGRAVGSVSPGSNYPAYGGLGNSLGRWGQGLGGLQGYGVPYPTSFSQVSPTARPQVGYYGRGGNSKQSPLKFVSRNVLPPVGWVLGGIYKGRGAQLSQSPVRYHGYSVGRPAVATRQIVYPRPVVRYVTYTIPHISWNMGGDSGYVSSYPTSSSMNTMSHGINHAPIHGGWGVGSPAGQTMNTFSHGIHPTVYYGGMGPGNLYGGYGAQYPAGASVRTPSHGVSYTAGYSSHYPASTSGSQTTNKVPNNVGSGPGSMLRGWGGYGLGYGVRSPVGGSVSRMSYGIGRPMGYGTMGLRFGVHYPVMTPSHGVSYTAGYSSHHPASTSGRQNTNRVPNTVGGGLGSMLRGWGGYGLGYGVRSPVGGSVSRMSYGIGRPMGYGTMGLRYGAHYPVRTPSHGVSYTAGYSSHYPASTSGRQNTNKVPNTVGGGLESMLRGWGGYGLGYGVRSPVGGSVSRMSYGIGRPMGYGTMGLRYGAHYPVRTPSHGVSYTAGYSSHYPASTSGSQNTNKVPNTVGGGLGSMLRGWSGYGLGYGVRSPVGGSVSRMSYGIGRPMGYGTMGLRYGTHYPVGQSVSTVPRGVGTPVLSGGLGLSALSGGYGTYRPTGSSSSGSQGVRSPLAYGGYGLRSLFGGHGVYPPAGSSFRTMSRGVHSPGPYHGYDLGCLFGGYGVTFPAGPIARRPITG